MTTNSRTEQASREILEQHFPDGCFIDDMLNTLSRAQGMAGLIADTATLAHEREFDYDVNMDNVRIGIREVEMKIKEAVIILNDYWFNKRKLEASNASHEGHINFVKELEK